MRYYIYNPRSVAAHKDGTVYMDASAYERLADGRIHEFIWLNDTQQWADVDPNGDDDDLPDEELLDVVIRVLRSDIRYVLSLIDPAAIAK